MINVAQIFTRAFTSAAVVMATFWVVLVLYTYIVGFTRKG